MIEQRNCELKTVPAAAELRKVPNFNPLQYLRKGVSRKTGEKVLMLDLIHKKRWFRLAFPHGRMVLTPLRITDQMALFRASLYSGTDDSQLLAEFTSNMERSEAGSQYIQAAQDEALNQALDNAGFGIQLSDLVETAGGSGCGSEILLSEVEAILKQMDGDTQPKNLAAAKPTHGTVETPAPVVDGVPVQENCSPVGFVSDTVNEAMKGEVFSDEPKTPVQAETITVEPVLETAPRMPQPAQKSTEPPAPEGSESTTATPAQDADITSEEAGALPTEAVQNAPTETADILQMLGAIPASEPKPQVSAPQAAAVVDFPLSADNQQDQEKEPTVDEGQGAESTFTEDMTVEEIRKLMTVEQAKAQMVTFGTNKGWNLGQVLDRRPSSLRFYALVAKEATNVLKAASFLLMDELNQAKAG